MIEKITLSNGVRAVLNHNDHFNSVSIGIYALAGLIQEPDSQNGIAHFLEHMSFKGTKRRSAKKIAEFIDNVGGKINAHTTKEYTCYYVTVLPQYLFKGLDLVSDIFLNSCLSVSDIQKEKQVILEEISMYDDTPDDKIHDNFSYTFWNKIKLGRPIIGTQESLENIDQKALGSFKNHYFNPKNIIISISGNILNLQRLIKTLEKSFNFKPSPQKSFYDYFEKDHSESLFDFEEKQTEQIHFCLGGQGIAFEHRDHFALSVLNTILGGSMSSRLFQKIRERRGYAYSVYSYLSFFKNSGLYTIYAGVNKDNFSKTLSIVLKEFKLLKTAPISSVELRKAKEHIKGNIILSLERSANWMSWLARSLLYYDKIMTLEELVAAVDNVTEKDIMRLSKNLFQRDNMALVVIGPSEHHLKIDSDNRLENFLERNHFLTETK